MTKYRAGHRRGLISCVLVALVACGTPQPPDSYERTVTAMGTLVHIEILAHDAARARQALDAAETLVTDIGRNWYAFGDGELGRVNVALAAGRPARATPELGRLIGDSLTYRAMSDGLFDPVIGDLVRLWGFADFDPAAGGTLPTEAAINAWRADRTTRQAVTLRGNIVTAPGPVRLDLGGVAKGAALEQTCALLAAYGIENAMVDAGGDLKVIGTRDTRPWRAGIRDPRNDGQVIATVTLKPREAIVTSGDYERYFVHEGQRHHHVLNPHTGRPTPAAAGVTVIHVDAKLADAAATALMVAGPDRFEEIAGRMGITTALLVTTDGTLITTPAMAQRIAPGAE